MIGNGKYKSTHLVNVYYYSVCVSMEALIFVYKQQGWA